MELRQASSIYLPGRLGLANPRFGPSSCGGFTSSFNLSPVISSGEDASIWTMSEQYCTEHGRHTFFEILSPWSLAVLMTFEQELAYSMRSLIDDPDGQV